MALSKARQTASLRTRARRFAMQALYQWDMSGNTLADIEIHFREDEDFSKVDGDYFHEILHTVPTRIDEIDAYYEPHLDRAVDRLDPVERALLRMATYELEKRIDIPYRVVLNESVNLAKKYGADQAHKYINGVLDKVARQLRPIEHPEASKKPDHL
ncbi:MAG: transcription antitermination factor NusB [Gammaproteobacteria bacterium]